MTDWISVEDRLPEEWVNVIATNGRTVRETYYVSDRYGWRGHIHFDSRRPIKHEEVITHWQPLPDPPEVTK